ncbi:hypothetical protein [Enterococcus avium]|uniref:hypothetical protein n=1 Tax=Enterococcus avium TaxID=33945 RepID=UPI00288C7B0F|nr:hypothetical protein [Enterococcus avium]MDT2390504.1 hypothetical protein [Enterococcus avium]
MLRKDAETLEDIRIVIMLLERAYFRELDVASGESFITKQIDDVTDKMNEIIEMLEGK